MREHYGRGPIKAKTYVLDNLIVCVLSDGLTAIERTMMEGGDRTCARDAPRLPTDDESPLQRDDRGAHRSQSARVPQPGARRARLTVEIFLLDGPVAGFGALELVDPPPSTPGNSDN